MKNLIIAKIAVFLFAFVSLTAQTPFLARTQQFSVKPPSKCKKTLKLSLQSRKLTYCAGLY